MQCHSMDQKKIQERKEKENEWNSWVKEKQLRLARLQKLQKKLNKSLKIEGIAQPHLTPTNFVPNENVVVSVIEAHKDKNGYTRLEVSSEQRHFFD